MAEVAQTSIASALATGPFSFGFHGPSAEILRRKAEVCATEVFSAAATYGQVGPRLPPPSVDNCQQASHYLSSKANGMETVTRPSTRTKRSKRQSTPFSRTRGGDLSRRQGPDTSGAPSSAVNGIGPAARSGFTAHLKSPVVTHARC